ncbi:MAG: DUF86 domain-containing protein [Methanobacterium sp.]|nr:DUF86 domain-containing protein [Methanobacterium sp.]
MLRDYRAFLEDIYESTIRIELYTEDISFEEFKKNTLLQDAVVRNLEIIGEASKNIPMTIREQNSEIEWKKITGLRDILIHAYFGIDLDIIWDVVKNKIPSLKTKISDLLKVE